ncbi:MAG: hypothetical protein OEO82_13325, partial [Gammaproteobacteria bacterium]|nr:hypothetical protein [Gammaproteobacteria bacterium]
MQPQVYGILADRVDPRGKISLKPYANILMQIRARSRLLLLLTAFGLLAACAGNDEQQTEVENVTEAYEEAKDAIARS